MLAGEEMKGERMLFGGKKAWAKWGKARGPRPTPFKAAEDRGPKVSTCESTFWKKKQ